mgnify:FL=1
MEFEVVNPITEAAVGLFETYLKSSLGLSFGKLNTFDAKVHSSDEVINIAVSMAHDLGPNQCCELLLEF